MSSTKGYKILNTKPSFPIIRICHSASQQALRHFLHVLYNVPARICSGKCLFSEWIWSETSLYLCPYLFEFLWMFNTMLHARPGATVQTCFSGFFYPANNKHVATVPPIYNSRLQMNWLVRLCNNGATVLLQFVKVLNCINSDMDFQNGGWAVMGLKWALVFCCLDRKMKSELVNTDFCFINWPNKIYFWQQLRYPLLGFQKNIFLNIIL